MALAAVLTVTFSACGQKVKEKDVPAVVKEAFQKQFAGAKEVEWEKEEGKYEVEFEQNDQEMSAVFTADGMLEETEIEIKKEALPSAVLTYLNTNYRGEKIKEAAKITKANGEVNYEAEVKGKDLMFDANGNFLMEKKELEDKD